MNTLLEDFRSDAPSTGPSLAVRRRALEPTLAPGRPALRPGRRRLSLGIAATVSATAAIATFVVQSGPGASPSAAAELRGIARDVRVATIPEPRGDQWIYTSDIQGRSGYVDHQWDRFDGKRMAYAEPSWKPGQPLTLNQAMEDDPRYISPRRYFEALSALPSDPERVVAAIRRLDPVPTEGSTRAARDFNIISFALTNMPLTPADAYPKLFRALATIPGVGVDREAAPDRLGRPVVAITFDGACEGCVIRSRSELLLDPSTYQVRGERLVALEDGSFDGRTVRTGDYWYDERAIVVQPTVVDRPGEIR